MSFLCMLMCLVCGQPPAHAQNLLPNGGFEAEADDNGLSAGWQDNSSWADLDVSYSRDTEEPHSGEACQRVTCTRLDAGAVQVIPEAWVPLQKGAIYRVRGWLRGDVGVVAAQLRLAPAPYTIYTERSVRVDGEWHEIDYLWTSRVDDPQGRFMLRFTEPGTLWVDDLSIEELTPEQARETVDPPMPGNLLHNGDFSLGLANWLANHGADHWDEAKLAAEREGGEAWLRVTVPEGVSVSVASDVVGLSQGHPIRASAQLRREPAGQVVMASDHVWRRVDVGEEWMDVAGTGTVGFGPDLHDFLRFSLSGPATLFVRNVALRQDGMEGDGPERARAGIVPDDAHWPMGLYCEPEEPQMRLVTNVPEGAGEVSFEWDIQDFWGETVRRGECEAGAGTSDRWLNCAGLPRGWYRATVRWMDGEMERANERVFCVLPPRGRSGDIKSSPFGAHFTVDETSLNLADAVGCRWLRLHPPNHTKWRVVEPTKGEWNWHDEAIRIAREAGLELVGSLDRCPDWASTAPEDFPGRGFYTGKGAWLPRDWAEWEEYVAQTVRRYRGDIHIWEVWNEPNLTNWLYPREGQTRAEAYVEMLQHTYPIVKREDPTAIVIGGCIAGAMTKTSGAWQFAQDIIDQGALELMDVLSFHDYIIRSVDEGSDPIDVWMPRLRENMRAAGRELPIINSEGGFATPGTGITYRPASGHAVPTDRMGRWIVRQYVSQLALGVKQFFFYNFFIDGSPITRDWEGFLEGDGQPLPNVAAFAAMTWLLDGAEFEGTDRPEEDVWVHYFATPRGRVAVAWTQTGTTAELALPGAKKAWSLMGAEQAAPVNGVFGLTDAPVYILLGE